MFKVIYSVSFYNTFIRFIVTQPRNISHSVETKLRSTEVLVSVPEHLSITTPVSVDTTRRLGVSPDDLPSSGSAQVTYTREGSFMRSTVGQRVINFSSKTFNPPYTHKRTHTQGPPHTSPRERFSLVRKFR